MTEKTYEQYKEQEILDKRLKEERASSDGLYAPIIIKVIVYGMVGMILVSVFGALLSRVIIK